MQAKRRKRPHAVRPRGSRSPFTEKEIAELSALEADIRAGRITEADGTSLEDHMDQAMRRVARLLRSRA